MLHWFPSLHFLFHWWQVLSQYIMWHQLLFLPEPILFHLQCVLPLTSPLIVHPVKLLADPSTSHSITSALLQLNLSHHLLLSTATLNTVHSVTSAGNVLLKHNWFYQSPNLLQTNMTISSAELGSMNWIASPFAAPQDECSSSPSTINCTHCSPCVLNMTLSLPVL